MPIPVLISDLSPTASANFPAGSDSPVNLDNVQRAHGAFIAQLRDGTVAHAASAKSALVDADEVTGGDSAASFGLIRSTWTSIKAFLKTYFDTLYPAKADTHYIGTTAIALNRASAAQALTGVSIDGSAASLGGGATFAAPGAIGGGTAAAGSFTTLSASGDATGMLDKLVLTNGYTTGSTTGVAIRLKSYDGSGVNTNASLFATGNSWNYGGYEANSAVLSGGGTGGVKIVASNATGSIKFIVGDENSVKATLSSTGLAVANNLSAAGTAIDFVTSGAVLTVGVGANNGTVSAGVFTDRTKAYVGDALTDISKITHTAGEIDHATLPLFAQVALVKPIHEARAVLKPIYEFKEVVKTVDVKGAPTEVTETVQVQIGEKTVIEQVKIGEYTATERDIGAMVSMLTVAVQQLTARLAVLEKVKI